MKNGRRSIWRATFVLMRHWRSNHSFRPPLRRYTSIPFFFHFSFFVTASTPSSQAHWLIAHSMCALTTFISVNCFAYKFGIYGRNKAASICGPKSNCSFGPGTNLFDWKIDTHEWRTAHSDEPKICGIFSRFLWHAGNEGVRQSWPRPLAPNVSMVMIQFIARTRHV